MLLSAWADVRYLRVVYVPDEVGDGVFVVTAYPPELTSRILTAIARHRVGNRPGRVEPRKIKRRPKNYSRLLTPREEARAEPTRRRTRS